MIDNDFFCHKKIIVTGGTGSIGEQLVSRLLLLGAAKVVVFSRSDTAQYLMQQKYPSAKNLIFKVGDVREYGAIKEASRDMDLFFHTAALKQVTVCEENPLEAVRTNVLGSANVIRACTENNVPIAINISTDKAVQPRGVMGTTKFLAEKLFQNAACRPGSGTRFCSVRFGNVLGSRGSVIPLWMDQFHSGKPLPVTDYAMTRFIMTIAEAVDLILKAAICCRGGEVFVPKIKSVLLKDLVDSFRANLPEKRRTGTSLAITGTRPGEKLFEQLLSESELERVVKDDGMYVVLPEHGNLPLVPFAPARIDSYRSDQGDTMTRDEISELLRPIVKQLRESCYYD